MAKKPTSFSISDAAREHLKKLAEAHNRSQANMLEELILNAPIPKKTKPKQ